MLDELVGRRIAVLHIMGGGTQNRLLSQLAANAIGRPVVAGPIEATAAGNILMQMLATGAMGSLAEGRAVIRRSFGTERSSRTTRQRGTGRTRGLATWSVESAGG